MVEEDPILFKVPRIAFSKNFKKLKTKASLGSSLHCFGKYTGLHDKTRYAGSSRIELRSPGELRPTKILEGVPKGPVLIRPGL